MYECQIYSKETFHAWKFHSLTKNIKNEKLFIKKIRALDVLQMYCSNWTWSKIDGETPFGEQLKVLRESRTVPRKTMRGII